MANIEPGLPCAIIGEGAAVRLGAEAGQDASETHVYFEPCEENKAVTVAESQHNEDGAGRVLDVNLVLRNVCPGKRVAVGFVNHAYWRNRFNMAVRGERIVNEVFPAKWDSARPMNAISVNSFKEFCAENDIVVARSHFLRGDWERPCKFFPNLFSGYAIFEILKKAK